MYKQFIYIYITQRFNLFVNHLFIKAKYSTFEQFLRYIKLLISNVPYLEMSAFSLCNIILSISQEMIDQIYN